MISMMFVTDTSACLPRGKRKGSRGLERVGLVRLSPFNSELSPRDFLAGSAEAVVSSRYGSAVVEASSRYGSA